MEDFPKNKAVGGRPEKGGKSSGFSALGLSANLVKAILKKGYKQPTPIQRKCIPLILGGKDLIGMARTGSGKTAAFVLPLLQTLRLHSAKTGIRALILAPNRELALQTLKFTQQMAKFTDLRVAALIGGDGLEEQFASLASNPDIVVATPGRLLHVCVEANISLKTVSVVVWDEADRLLEDPSMGEQLKDIMARCPASKQTALFSATIPSALAEFARVGLNDVTVVKLDNESKLSPDLKTVFLSIKSEDREANLLNILMNQVKITTAKPMTVIFAATKHHVEYLQELLNAMGIPSCYIYGSLDQSARESALEMFKCGRRRVLIVTDVASRGIDIPLLDVVINYSFPATPKLFVHRVGRVARAGRSGTAYSLVAPDELPYLFELQLFLEKSLVVAKPNSDLTDGETILLGAIKQEDIDTESERLRTVLSMNGTLSSLKQVVTNATKLYNKTRVAVSSESHRRVKAFMGETAVIGPHPALYKISREDISGIEMLAAIKTFKPKVSFLEMTNAQASKSAPAEKGKQRVSASPSDEVDFKDSQNYLSYKPAKGGDNLSFGRLSSSNIFDINGAKKDDLIKIGTMLSSKLKRQRETKNQIAKMKTEYGTSVPKSYKAGNYEKWCAKTRLTIPKPGEQESNDGVSRAKAIVSGSIDRKKWRKPKVMHRTKPARK